MGTLSSFAWLLSSTAPVTVSLGRLLRKSVAQHRGVGAWTGTEHGCCRIGARQWGEELGCWRNLADASAPEFT